MSHHSSTIVPVPASVLFGYFGLLKQSKNKSQSSVLKSSSSSGCCSGPNPSRCLTLGPSTDQIRGFYPPSDFPTSDASCWHGWGEVVEFSSHVLSHWWDVVALKLFFFPSLSCFTAAWDKQQLIGLLLIRWCGVRMSSSKNSLILLGWVGVQYFQNLHFSSYPKCLCMCNFYATFVEGPDWLWNGRTQTFVPTHNQSIFNPNAPFTSYTVVSDFFADPTYVFKRNGHLTVCAPPVVGLESSVV